MGTSCAQSAPALAAKCHSRPGGLLRRGTNTRVPPTREIAALPPGLGHKHGWRTPRRCRQMIGRSIKQISSSHFVLSRPVGGLPMVQTVPMQVAALAQGAKVTVFDSPSRDGGATIFHPVAVFRAVIEMSDGQHEQIDLFIRTRDRFHVLFFPTPDVAPNCPHMVWSPAKLAAVTCALKDRGANILPVCGIAMAIFRADWHWSPACYT